MASQLSTVHFGRALVGVCAVFSIALWAIPVKAQTGSPATTASVAPPSTSTSTSTRPVRVQILVDESVNVTDAQIHMEAAAADKIANAALAGEHAAPGEYQVAVSGFGSAPAEGRSAFDRVCPFREAGPASPTAGQATTASPIADCVAGLHKRTSSEGNDADIAGVLRFFGKDLADNTAVGTRRVLVLLAGGPQAVPNVVAYDDLGRPGDRARRTVTARDQLINAVPGELKDKQIEVWPLGFGSADTASLSAIARDGYPGAGRCELPATPSVNTPGAGEDLLTATERTIAALTPLNQCRATATVQIPLPATDATISVWHEDRLMFSFCEPHPVGGPRDCSDKNVIRPGKTASDAFTFERAPAAGGYDRLHITRPMPGEWTVVATAPPGGPPITIDVHVDWDQKPRTAMLVRPAPPQPGAADSPPMVNVEARLYTRADALKIPGALAGVTARLTVDYGAGNTKSVDVPPQTRAAADSGGSDIVVFTAPLQLLDGTEESLKVTADISGAGFKVPSFDYHTSIDDRPGPIVTIPTLNGPIPRGGSVSAYLTVTGSWGTTSEITVKTLGVIGGITIDPAVLHRYAVEDGKPVLLTIHADKNAPLGPSGGIIQVFDAGLPSRWLGDQFVTLTVVPFPADSPTDQWDQWMIAFFVLLSLVVICTAGAGVLEYLRRHARNAAVDGLTVWLYHDAQLLSYFEPDDPRHRTMSFAVRRLGDGNPRLVAADRADPDSPRFELRRNGTRDVIELRKNAGENVGWVKFPTGDSVAHSLDDRVVFKITDIGPASRCSPSVPSMEELTDR